MRQTIRELKKLGITSKNLDEVFVKRVAAFVSPVVVPTVTLANAPAPKQCDVVSNAVKHTRNITNKSGDSDGDDWIIERLKFSHHPAIQVFYAELLQAFRAIPSEQKAAKQFYQTFALASLCRFDLIPKNSFTPEQVKQFRNDDYHRRNEVCADLQNELSAFDSQCGDIAALIEAKRKADGRARSAGKRGVK